jgi:ABC-type transport system substrate-binding protein
MKRVLAAAVITVMAGAGLVGGAMAQNAGPPANHNASTPAVATSGANNPGAPIAGANSFTEAEAKSRIEKAGYTSVAGLTKDKDGIWRGEANNGSATVPVALDYQGNVVPK